ncbi:probable E3 ubiquitin-protein ligase HERC4 isoform X1 [Varroa destructor]|uniref:Uncharacterized protein n=1 Tax=Varroa destructor TaxID=109461 RepID=A0A7M7J1X7_VARDE|nr:probable E3 ubiquitin-protein ligase HERC4 isoform X1 [Varroa destructor]
MWKVTQFPLSSEYGYIKTDQVFLGWKQILAYCNGSLKDLVSGATSCCQRSFTSSIEIFKGSLDDCSLSRDYCAFVELARCRIIGLYDKSVVDVPISNVQQVSMLERDRVALRTQTDVAIYDLKAKSMIKSWPLRCSQISAGFDHLLALTSDGAVYCWGDGFRGQQGSGELVSSEDLVPVEALEEVNIVEVAAGGWHCSALSQRGFMYQWGWNQHNQIDGPLEKDHRLIRSGGKQTVIASPTLQNTGDQRVIAVACGSRHSVALDKCGRILTWGWNEYGQCDLNNLPLQKASTEKNISTDNDKTSSFSDDGTNVGVCGDQSRMERRRETKFVCNNDTERNENVRKAKRIRAAFWTTAVQY